MLARSVVRLINHNNKPSLFLEASYGNREFEDLIVDYEEMLVSNGIEIGRGTIIEDLFEKALKQFTNKLPVISAIRSNIDNSYIYGSKQIKDLVAIENGNKFPSYINFNNFKCLSYCDAGLNYNMKSKLSFKS